MNKHTNKQDNSSTLLKASDVAKILNVSRTFAYQLMRQGKIPTVRIIGARRVRPSDLDHFIVENTKD